MQWKTWGTVLVLCGLAAGRADAGLFDRCHGDTTSACPDYSYSYTCATPSYGCCPSGQNMYGNACCGYDDDCDDDCCFERCWRRLCNLENRKNRWLLRTFFGCCHDDDECYQTVPDCQGPASYPAPYNCGSYYGTGSYYYGNGY